jgi:fermentation-respiration switch protein FrsA (DUF1100 family)
VGWPLLALWTYFVLSYFARQAAFHPSPYPEGAWDIQQKLDAEDVWMETSDGLRIHGWMVPAKQSKGLVTLYLHGNAGNITHRADHLLAIPHIGSETLIIDYRGYGKSEAARRACAGIILEAPFPSGKAVAQRVLPLLGPLVAPGFKTAEKLQHVKCPVLVIHGDRDQVIDYDLGRAVFEAAREPKELWTVEGAQHSDIVLHAGREYLDRVGAFYESLRP